MVTAPASFEGNFHAVTAVFTHSSNFAIPLFELVKALAKLPLGVTMNFMLTSASPVFSRWDCEE